MNARAVRVGAGLVVLVAVWGCADNRQPAVNDRADAKPAQSQGVAPRADEGALRADLEMAREVRVLLPPNTQSMDEFMRRFANFDSDAGAGWNGVINDNREIGFGGQLIDVQRGGTYTIVWVRSVAFDGEFAELRLQVEGPGADADDPNDACWGGIRDRIVAEWGLAGVRENENGFEWWYVDAARKAHLRDAAARELDKPAALSVPSDLAPAYALLISAMTDTDVGERCYFDGSQPPGRIAIERLQKAGRWDLIRNVLRGLSPEGRVYAAQALLTAAEPGEAVAAEDKAVIRKIRRLNILISVCNGCFITHEPATAILPEVPE